MFLLPLLAFGSVLTAYSQTALNFGNDFAHGAVVISDQPDTSSTVTTNYQYATNFTAELFVLSNNVQSTIGVTGLDSYGFLSPTNLLADNFVEVSSSLNSVGVGSNPGLGYFPDVTGFGYFPNSSSVVIVPDNAPYNSTVVAVVTWTGNYTNFNDAFAAYTNGLAYMGILVFNQSLGYESPGELPFSIPVLASGWNSLPASPQALANDATRLNYPNTPDLIMNMLTVAPPPPPSEFTFTTNNDGLTLTITGTTDTVATVTSLAVPDAINGMPVTIIGQYAFANYYNLTSITLGTNVTTIFYYAFQNCSSLTGITFPDSVTDIDYSAFEACQGLTSLTFPPNLATISDSAFAGCENVTNISTIPASVTYIGGAAFEFCYLTAITVDPSNPDYSSVDGVLFDKLQTTLLQYPIANTNASYTIPNTVTSIGYTAFGISHYLVSVTIPNSVTSIGYAAFEDSQALTSVTIPNSVTSVGNGAFLDCASVTNIYIGSGLTSVGDPGTTSYAFSDLQALTAITVDANNPAYSSLAGVMFNKLQTTLIQYPVDNPATSYTIPNTVTNIGNYSFAGSLNLVSPTIPNSVISIGAEAFFDCPNLSGITIPASVTSIGDEAFCVCPLLTVVYALNNPPPGGISPIAFDPPTIYYLPGATNWATYSAANGIPATLWLPQATRDASFGVRTNQFGFNVNWVSGQKFVVEACTNLANPVWHPIQTNTLNGNSAYFSDPQWTNHPTRFYRVGSP